MQPDKVSFSSSVANTGENASASQRNFAELIAETQAEQHPALETLRQIIDRPDLHSVGDLAAMTERLTSEMMLFNALVGGPLAQFSPQIDPLPPVAAPGMFPPASDEQTALLAEFLRDLEG
jgi:hypothetical protein